MVTFATQPDKPYPFRIGRDEQEQNQAVRFATLVLGAL
ncbi:hypothetical protein VII00023_02974 [Vibrio ichthyoenteri ATCC 700023]|uniref:Uncharacterized protein n=1 Tax=Vibrio ichthyoenteri ATCC 700023 TaxID=870968 RepID=F9S0Z6_9VIBR|nr:hypothetical protein VII00023_02974 [Vibrio ichthyoenteri ATCC 700023]